MEFYKGVPKWDTCQKKDLNGKKNGTYIIYKPSQEVFKSEPIEFKFDDICVQMQEYAYFNKGITFVVTNDETKETRKFLSKNGLIDFVRDTIDKPIHKTPLQISFSENEIDGEIILQWTANRQDKMCLFSNGGENENGGTPITGIKTAFTNFFKKKFKGDFNADIARKGLFCVCSVNLKDPIYDGQTKSKITNPELRGLCQRATTQMLEEFELKHRDEFEKILELLTKELKAERAAEKARQNILNATKDIEKNQKKKVFASDKLKDAEFLGQDSTLLLVEGNSAAASMAIARDITHYGILALRGKLINCLSNPDEKIFENEEIKLLLSALNINPSRYDASKLRYGRVAICTDADSDGSHIGLLIMAALTHLAPEFVKEGRLYWLRSPLYIVKNNGKESYYFTDDEFNKVRGKVKGEVNRAKGLGALSEAQAHNSMFTKEFQRMEQMKFSNESDFILRELMGEDVEPRSEFVFSKIDFSTIRE